MKPFRSELNRFLALVLVSLLALQLYFAARVACIALVAPESTSFQRSEAWRLLKEKRSLIWSQQWVDKQRLPDTLKRAVIASEDAGFTQHGGVDWAAVKSAWDRNQRTAMTHPDAKTRGLRVVGGSTISQQLAKNLFLSGERTTLRKAQELLITIMLEGMLDKPRILEVYLNSVEWGEGIFGAQAAAQHYFHQDASKLTSPAAARLAVMLPAPKRFERQPSSGYVLGRAAVIEARMNDVELP